MPHGGFVIHTGTTGNYNKQRMEFSLTLRATQFTSSILVHTPGLFIDCLRKEKRSSLLVCHFLLSPKQEELEALRGGDVISPLFIRISTTHSIASEHIMALGVTPAAGSINLILTSINTTGSYAFWVERRPRYGYPL